MYRVFLQRALTAEPAARRMKSIAWPAARLFSSNSEEKMWATLKDDVEKSIGSLSLEVSKNSSALLLQQEQIKDLQKKNLEVLVSVSQEPPQTLKFSVPHPEAPKLEEWSSIVWNRMGIFGLLGACLIIWKHGFQMLKEVLESLKLIKEAFCFVRDNWPYVKEYWVEIVNYLEMKIKGAEQKKLEEIEGPKEAERKKPEAIEGKKEAEVEKGDQKKK